MGTSAGGAQATGSCGQCLVLPGSGQVVLSAPTGLTAVRDG